MGRDEPLAADWRRVAETPAWGSDAIHVWAVWLDRSPGELAEFRKTLSGDELARADRFRLPMHRERFVAARGWLRRILANYLYVAPAELRFTYGPQGKPSLADPSLPLRFNLTHSADLALIACSQNRELGIDVEEIRLLSNADPLATRYFAAEEAASYLQVEPLARPAAFFDRWTLKEAYIKARGRGLAIPLDEFVIREGPTPEALHVTSTEPADDVRWKFVRLNPHSCFRAALAYEGPVARLERYQT